MLVIKVHVEGWRQTTSDGLDVALALNLIFSGVESVLSALRLFGSL